MKNAKLKSIGILLFLISLFAVFIYGLSGTPESPIASYIDDDGYLDLRGACIPTSQSTTGDYDGTTSYNISNATIYSNVDGTWKANATLYVSPIANVTYFFNFTNHINQSAEGTFQWSILCREVNATGTVTNVTTIFTANRTIIVDYADVALESTSPADGYYDLDGDDISIVCTGNAADNWNITLAEVMVAKDSDAYASNQSYYPGIATGVEVVFNATLGNYTDGTDVTWACRYTQIQNITKDDIIITSLTSTANRTINIEFPPLVTLNAPADSSWQSGASSRLNFTVTSAFTSGTVYHYQLWTNETGTWLVRNSGTAINNTPEILNYQFPNSLSDISWGIRAFEDNNVFNSSINRTINTDRTLPTVSITQLDGKTVENNLFVTGTNDFYITNESVTISVLIVGDTNSTILNHINIMGNHSVFNATSPTDTLVEGTEYKLNVVDGNFTLLNITSFNNTLLGVTYTYFTQFIVINYSFTESNKDTCRLFINDSLNSTSTTTSNNFTFSSNIDGDYEVLIGCNDSAGNYVNSTKYNFTIDDTYPTSTGIDDRTPDDTADVRVINFSTNELTNATLYYGTSTDTTSAIRNASFVLIQNITLDNLLENTIYYYNLTICDRAGNCNNTVESVGQQTFTFPWKLLTGWSYYGVYDASKNFSTILNESDAEYAYFWNATSQDWVYATQGGTDSMAFSVGTNYANRHVIHLYTSTNSTWAERNTTNSDSAYSYNITSGNNYIKIPGVFTFGNFSITLLNGSYNRTDEASSIAGYGFGYGPTTQTSGGVDNSSGLTYNLTAFGFWSYNNTLTDWDRGYSYNWSWNNNSPILTHASATEVMWLWSESNITWNTTHVNVNWSI